MQKMGCLHFFAYRADRICVQKISLMPNDSRLALCYAEGFVLERCFEIYSMHFVPALLQRPQTVPSDESRSACDQYLFHTLHRGYDMSFSEMMRVAVSGQRIANAGSSKRTPAVDSGWKNSPIR